MLNEEPEDDIELVIVPQEIRGFKVLMMDMNHPKKEDEEAPIYGIKKIEVERPGEALSLQSCGAQGTDSKIMNRFKVEEVEYINIAYKVPYEMAENYLDDVYDESVFNIRKFMEKIMRFRQVLERAQRIKEVIEQMNIKLGIMSKQLGVFSTEINKKCNEDNEQVTESYAGTPEKAALNCQKIKEYADYKRNGYYWVQTKCMPKPERVYCDMEDNYPNFYHYDGWHRDKQNELVDANSADGIKRICGKLGLFPVRIGTEKQYLNIVDFLNESNANSENNFAIPIGYKWSSWPLEKFRSFSASDSPDLDQKLKKYIATGFFKSLFGPVYDSLLLINSKN